MNAQYAGIDYGLGLSNVDRNTGIRYGVISQHSVDSDALYGNSDDTAYEEAYDAALAEAKLEDPGLDAEDFDPMLEDVGIHIKDAEYEIVDCLDSDIMVLRSPYFTFAQFCSPCVPGAGNLDNPMGPDSGAKCYCLGHEWFEDGKAPYTVYSVETGQEVMPEVD